MLGRLLVAALLVAALLAATPATATFRGHNGLIAFDRVRDEAASVFAVDPSGGPEVMLAVDAQFPAWSPDGTRIAFRRDSDLYVANADGSNQHQVSPPGTYWFDLAWSPNGRRLVGVKDAGANTFSLWTMNADGSGLRPLPIRGLCCGSAIAPAWSPNGRWIAFLFLHSVGTGSVTSTDIWLVRPDGTRARRLTRTLVQEGRPSWSPDSTRLVYDRQRKWDPDNGSDYDIVVRSLRTGRTRVLLGGAADDGSPVWSPDGRMIAFTHLVDPTSNTRAIEVADINGRHRHALVRVAWDSVYGLDWQALP
jgi:Tol biopolymer transport system component